MKPNRAEEELAAFLESKPSWVRKYLQLDYSSFTRDEMRAYFDSADQSILAKEEYERLLQRVPREWKRYREKLKQQALTKLPPARPGAPRKDSLAQEAGEFRASGKSYAQIANTLNAKYGPGTTNKEAIRKLLKSRQKP